jgi:hypothetical protein
MYMGTLLYSVRYSDVTIKGLKGAWTLINVLARASYK